VERLGLSAGVPLLVDERPAGLFLRAATGDHPSTGQPIAQPRSVDVLVIGGSPASRKSTLCRN
jgi:hypothetical protein